MKQLTIPVMTFSLLALGFAKAGHTQGSPGDRCQVRRDTKRGRKGRSGQDH